MLVRVRRADARARTCVIVGRSNIVGKPMAALLMQPGTGADATVTICHSRTRDLAVAHAPRRHPDRRGGHGRSMVTADMVKPGAVVIDVGMNRVRRPDDEERHAPGRRRGLRRACVEVASLITPVPGGVGPMTIAMLLREHGARRARTLGRDAPPRAPARGPRRSPGSSLFDGAEPAPPYARGGRRLSRREPRLGDRRSRRSRRRRRTCVEGAFPPLWVRGEVSDFKAHRNGHWYFSPRATLASQLRCVVWSRDQRGIPAPPDDGMQVIALRPAHGLRRRAARCSSP